MKNAATSAMRSDDGGDRYDIGDKYDVGDVGHGVGDDDGGDYVYVEINR